MFLIQEFLLKIFGLLSLSSSETKSRSFIHKISKSILSHTSPIFAVLFLLGCFYTTALDCLAAVWETVLAVLHASDPKPDNPAYILLHIYTICSSLLRYACSGLRSLVIAFPSWHEWRALEWKLHETMLVCFSDSPRRYTVLLEWRKYSIGLSLLTLTLHIR